MKQERLRLYQIDLKYIRDLAQKDNNVHSTISPQIGITRQRLCSSVPTLLM